MALIYLAGKDPTTAVGGHTTYVQAHALAAVVAGYTPHLVCVGRDAARIDTAYGVVHRVASPFPWRRHPTMVAHGPFLTAAVWGLAEATVAENRLMISA